LRMLSLTFMVNLGAAPTKGGKLFSAGR
jgi:hypothetical protein